MKKEEIIKDESKGKPWKTVFEASKLTWILFIKALVKTFASDSFWQGFSLPNNPLSHPVRKKEENQSRQWRETQFFYDLIIQQRRKKNYWSIGEISERIANINISFLALTNMLASLSAELISFLSTAAIPLQFNLLVNLRSVIFSGFSSKLH